MDSESFTSNLTNLSSNANSATKLITNVLIRNIWPLIIKIRNKLNTEYADEDSVRNTRDVFTLCCSQIRKCIINLFEVFKLEYTQDVLLREARHFMAEQLSWCVNRLNLIDKTLDKIKNNSIINESVESLVTPPMYFVNWIDHAFETLAKLSTIVYKNDENETQDAKDSWKSEVVECVSELHITMDELLLSAMTLCKHCLDCDQLVVKARCQVVLRETKALINELITEDINTAYKVTKESLKLPIMPSNVNVLIDVLKDVLYALETNTNTALLALVVHCFSDTETAVDKLHKHFTSEGCSCVSGTVLDVMENCLYIKDFDLFNERLMQIGSFAMSCSSDQARVLSLRSGLASLEWLDGALVPGVVSGAVSGAAHRGLLRAAWAGEVRAARDSVYLIVDPAAFTEKAKQMMHQALIQIIENKCYHNTLVCTVINTGCVVEDFFKVYNTNEPEALICHDKLILLLADLNKVQIECKIVSNALSAADDTIYKVKNSKETNNITFERLLKRLKLLYTVVNRINTLFHPKDNDDNLFVNEICEEIPEKKDETHTICKMGTTYVNSHKKTINNLTKSVFSRTTNTRGIQTGLARLTKHLKLKMKDELSFSMQLDEMFDIDQSAGKTDKTVGIWNKHLALKEKTILYNSPKKRSSLRKAVLDRNSKMPSEDYKQKSDLTTTANGNGAAFDESYSLQITEILDQLTDISSTFCKDQPSTRKAFINQTDQNITRNVLKLNVNTEEAITKRIWNIPVNATTVDLSLDSNNLTFASQPSRVSTLERLNDLQNVEDKLNVLKLLQKETTL